MNALKKNMSTPILLLAARQRKITHMQLMQVSQRLATIRQLYRLLPSIAPRRKHSPTTDAERTSGAVSAKLVSP